MTKLDIRSALKAPFAKRYENFIGGEWRARARRRQLCGDEAG